METYVVDVTALNRRLLEKVDGDEFDTLLLDGLRVLFVPELAQGKCGYEDEIGMHDGDLTCFPASILGGKSCKTNSRFEKARASNILICPVLEPTSAIVAPNGNELHG